MPLGTPGTWFGLPDFSLTEALGGTLGASQAGTFNNPAVSTLGANLPQGQYYANPTSQGNLGRNTDYLSGIQSALAARNQALDVFAKQKQNTPITPPGGGGGGTGLDPHINPATGVWDDNYFNSQNNSAQQSADAELQAAMSAFDYERQGLEAQSGTLATQRGSALSDIGATQTRAQEQAALSATQATSETQKATSKALSTAQGVQRSNRNVLRALGILSSSASGEMLGKPITEYGKQAADLQQSLMQRKGDIDTWLRDRMTEAQTAVRDIEQQYATMTDNIQRDLRFNGQQKTDAVRQITAALQARKAQVMEQAKAYEMSARQYNNGVLAQIAQIQTYKNPQANTSAIQQGLLSNMIPQGISPQQLSITQTDEQRRRLSGLGA